MAKEGRAEAEPGAIPVELESLVRVARTYDAIVRMLGDLVPRAAAAANFEHQLEVLLRQNDKGRPKQKDRDAAERDKTERRLRNEIAGLQKMLDDVVILVAATPKVTVGAGDVPRISVEQLSDENTALKQELEEARRAAEVREKQEAEAAAMRHRLLKADREKIDEDRKSIDEELDRLEAERDRLAAERNEFEKRLAGQDEPSDNDERIAELEAQLDKTKEKKKPSSRAGVNEVEERLRVQIVELEAQLATAVVTAVADSNEDAHRLREAQQELERLQLEHDHAEKELREEIESLRQASETSMHADEDVAKARKAADDRLEAARTEIETLAAERDELKERIEGLASGADEVKDAESRATKLAEKLDKLQANAAEAQGELSSTREKLQTAEKELEKANAAVEKKDENAKKAIRDLGQSAAQLDKAEGKLKEATAAAESRAAEINRLGKELDAGKEALKKAKAELDQVASLGEELEAAKTALASALANAESLGEDLYHLKKEARRIPDLELEVEGLRKELKRVDEGLAAQQDEVAKTQEALKAEKSRAATLDKKVAKLEKDLSKAKDAEKEAKEAVPPATALQLTQLQASNASLHGKLKDAEAKAKNLDAVRSELEETKASLETAKNKAAKVETLKIAMSELETALNEKKAEVEAAADVEAELAKVNKALNKAKTDKLSSSRELATVKAALAETEKALADLSGLKSQLTELRVDVKTAEIAANEAEEATFAIQAQLDAQVEAGRASSEELLAIQDELAETRSKLEATEGQLTGNLNELSELRTELAEARQALELRDGQLAQTHQEKSVLQKALDAKGSESGDKRDLHARIGELEEQRSTFELALEQAGVLKAEHQDLAKAYEDLQKSHFERGSQLMQALTESERLRANLDGIAKELQALRKAAAADKGSNAALESVVRKRIEDELRGNADAHVEKEVRARHGELLAELDALKGRVKEAGGPGRLQRMPDSRSLREQLNIEDEILDISREPNMGADSKGPQDAMTLSPEVPSGIGDDIDAMFGGPLADGGSKKGGGAKRDMRSARSTQVGWAQSEGSRKAKSKAQSSAKTKSEPAPKPRGVRDRRDDAMAYLKRKRLIHKKPTADFAHATGVDHRAAFLLTQVDGDLTLEDLIDLSGLGTDVAADLVVDLIDRGALVF